MSRRGLFRPMRARQEVRPPWAAEERLFLDRCDRCNACRRACEPGILVAGDGGFPVVDFTKGECTFCGLCAEACRPGALRRTADGQDGRPWTLTAAINGGCMAAAGVDCRVCGEWCPAGALRFRPRVGGPARPEVDQEACTGCGACVAPCPVGALTVRPPAASSQAGALGGKGEGTCA